MVKLSQHPSQNIRFTERRKKHHGWHYEIRTLKLNFSWLTCIISRLGSGHENTHHRREECFGSYRFWSGDSYSGEKFLWQGLALAERLGWGGVGPFWFNHFLEDPKQSQTLSRPWSGSVWAQTSPQKLWGWPSVRGPSWGVCLQHRLVLAGPGFT